jgi:hypothetical protein
MMTPFFMELFYHKTGFLNSFLTGTGDRLQGPSVPLKGVLAHRPLRFPEPRQQVQAGYRKEREQERGKEKACDHARENNKPLTQLIRLVQAEEFGDTQPGQASVEASRKKTRQENEDQKERRPTASTRCFPFLGHVNLL